MTSIFLLQKNFLTVAIGNAANHAAFTDKHFYALIIIKELNLDRHLSNQNGNNTCTFINNKTKYQIIEEHKLYLSKLQINLTI